MNGKMKTTPLIMLQIQLKMSVQSTFKNEKELISVCKVKRCSYFQFQYMLLIPKIYFCNLCQCDHVALQGWS